MLSTKSKGALSPEEKKIKVEAARQYHNDLLVANGLVSTDFNFKYPFTSNNTKIVALFPNEFKKKNGFYMEFCDSNLNPTDPERTVYKIGPIENYEDVYELLPAGTYAVPLEELDVVKKEVKQRVQDFKVDFDTLAEVKDDNITNMTITDFAAIMWMKPVSQKNWLNNLISQNLND